MTTAHSDTIDDTPSTGCEPLPARPPAAARSSGFGRLAWVLAAGLGITVAALWAERAQLFKEVAMLRSEALGLRTRDTVSKMQIVTLAAQDQAYAKAAATLVWDAAQQRGVIQIAHLPPAAAGHDYQLWISDPRRAQPVSAGVLPVGNEGRTRHAFTPARTLRSAEKFAVTLERAGGAAAAAGPVVLHNH